PFTVGPSNMNDGRQLLVRVAELIQKPLDTPERQVDQLRMQPLHLGKDIVTCGHKGSTARYCNPAGVNLSVRAAVGDQGLRAPSSECGRAGSGSPSRLPCSRLVGSKRSSSA